MRSRAAALAGGAIVTGLATSLGEFGRRVSPWDAPRMLGWIAVGSSTLIACFWAFWGILENFHEGWFYESWVSNVGLMIVQYLSPMLVFVTLALLGIRWPLLGSASHVLLA